MFNKFLVIAKQVPDLERKDEDDRFFTCMGSRRVPYELEYCSFVDMKKINKVDQEKTRHHLLLELRNFSGDFGETEDVRSVTFRFQIKEGSRFDDFADLIESMRQNAPNKVKSQLEEHKICIGKKFKCE